MIFTDALKSIITDLLKCFYEHLFSAIVMSILVMALCLWASELGSFKPIFQKWITAFRHSKRFRLHFVGTIYIFILLNRTLLNRAFYGNPLSDVIGIFSLVNAKGKINSEPIENIILFIPFSIFLFVLYPRIYKTFHFPRRATRLGKLCSIALLYSFIASFAIEITQVVLDLGTFQLADLVHNTTGALVGAIIYWAYTNRKYARRTGAARQGSAKRADIQKY